ncbi:MAG: TIGR00730 family Rossman fold protein, partial [Bacteroidetes bacterium]|nr:TIGR00730 family Rossman fold protein [Bacteroidota bacterium]
KLVRFPIVLMSKMYWQGLMDWINNTMLPEQNIKSSDLDIFSVVDAPHEAVAVIDEFYNKYALKPNF